MASNYDDADGVWRTIGGRRVFIRNGQSLSEAMIQSGKFKNLRSDYKKAKEEVEKLKQDKEWEEKVKKLEEENAKNKGYELSKEEEPEKKKLMGYRINEEGKKELYEHTEEDNELGHWEKDTNGNRVFVKNPRYKEETDREQELKAKQEAVNKSFEENQKQLKDAQDELASRNKNNEIVNDDEKSLKYSFRVGDRNIFEVRYDRTGNNKNMDFATSSSELNKRRTDITRGGQAQKDLLKEGTKARDFYEKWDKKHLGTLTQKEYNELVNDIEDLKKEYPHIEGNSFYAQAQLDRDTKASKSTNKTMNDKIRNSAYKKYMKEHPNSKMTLEEFKNNKKKK